MSFCKPYSMIAVAALTGATLPWVASAQNARRVADTRGTATPVVRSDLWLLIDAQRHQVPPATLPPATNHHRLTPEQRLQLREQLRQAYQTYSPEARPSAPLSSFPEVGN